MPRPTAMSNNLVLLLFMSSLVSVMHEAEKLLLTYFLVSFARHGFIVAVTDVVEISDGLILAGRGEVLFHVTYRAVLFRPIKGEVVDAVVKTVAKVSSGQAVDNKQKGKRKMGRKNREGISKGETEV